jgi:hypothetical protein
MRSTIWWSAMVAVLFGCSSAPAAPAAQPQPSSVRISMQEARTAAEAWLDLIDREDYDGSWQQAAQRSRGLFPREQWIASLRNARSALGRPTVRELLTMHPLEAPPGAPAGEYVELEYRRGFPNDALVTENIVLLKEEGMWRGFSYRVSRVPRSG